MGCDIHLFVERLVQGKWTHVPAPATWDHWELKHVEKPDAETGSYRNNGTWFSNRDYALFAFLADVRNYHGQKPLAKPRGVPGDASREVKRERRRRGVDGHSASRFTLAELRAGLDGLVVREGGRMSPSTYETWKAKGGYYPESWYKWSSGIAETLTEGKYLARRETGTLPDRPFDIEVAWEIPGKHAFSAFEAFLNEIEKLGPPNKVRVVFWFDN